MTAPPTAEDVQRHIIDVAMGRVRLNKTPDEVEQYIQAQFRRLQGLNNASKRSPREAG